MRKRQLESNLPLRDFLVTPHDAVLDVYGMVAHTPQQYGLIESADDEYSVVQFWVVRHEISLGRGRRIARYVADHRLLHALGPPEKTEVTSSRVDFVRIAGDQPCVKVIGIVALVAVDGEIATCVVRRLHPDLAQMRVAALAFRLGVRDDHFHTRQQLARLHQA